MQFFSAHTLATLFPPIGSFVDLHAVNLFDLRSEDSVVDASDVGASAVLASDEEDNLRSVHVQR